MAATNMCSARSLSSATEKHSAWRETDAAPRVGWISCRSELELAACEDSMDTRLVRAASGPRTAGPSSMASTSALVLFAPTVAGACSVDAEERAHGLGAEWTALGTSSAMLEQQSPPAGGQRLRVCRASQRLSAGSPRAAGHALLEH